MPSTSYVPTLLQTSSPTSGGPLAPRRLCFDIGFVQYLLINRTIEELIYVMEVTTM